MYFVIEGEFTLI